jgi:ATP-dependent 26S proteasome regulatory subunit
MNSALDTVNYIFASIFSLELIMKYIGFGNRLFKDSWNVFDTTIVFVTLLSIIISQNSQYQLGPQTTVIRSFRIARLFQFFKRNRALKSTF